ncbi:MAG TPA: hypothetical protein VHF69_03635 [Candidatus Synoicihabitans sp.]|nr:hypothetical protein [Candidatus Synoicihabitans sp.]
MKRKSRRSFAWRSFLLGLVLGASAHFVYTKRDFVLSPRDPLPPPLPPLTIETPPAKSPEVVPPPTPAATAATQPATPAAPPITSGDRWLETTLDELVRQHPELQLTDDELTRLREVYVHHQHVRTAFEADIAQVTSIDANRARIRIPPYPVAGARLQQLFVADVNQELGPDVSGAVDEHLGDTLDVAFKWFGASAQELEVELKRDPAEGLMYRIVARMDFADVSDPQLGGDDTRLFSITSHYQFRPETIATGEWRPLARHFPRLPDPASAP